MATIKTFSQISQGMINYIRLRQPSLTTNPGSVSRDVFIDAPSDQLAAIYRQLQLIQKTQSLLNATGTTLDQFGSNYGIKRDPGQNATGNAILTFNTLLNNISIQSGTTVTAKTGVVFQITSNILISAATPGAYSSYAISIASQLNIAGITDQYAVQVPIQALNVGSNGNIPIYSIVKTSISGITNVTNIAPTTGGTNPQSDPTYLNEILAGLSGSAAGTSRGYQNALLAVSGVQSVYVASAGSPILTRDGTVTQRNVDGSITIITPGNGGDVDIWIQGSDEINITESYIFHDISGTGNITSPLDAHIMGQIANTSTLTAIEKRQLFTQTGQLPQQPVDSIVNVTGSVSGSNFIQGINYELVKDTNDNTANTCFAMDNLTWLQNFVSIEGENVAKGNVNSVDALVFAGIKSVNSVQQSVIVTNDLATITSADHTQIAMPHKPLNNVLRATNLTTGERYVITNQNIDPTTGLNLTGNITITGSILPSLQDLIQVDYTWDFTFDPTTDYNSPNTLQFDTTGIDWGKSNYITFESGLLIRNGNRYNVGLTRNIDRVYSAFFCDTQNTNVQQANLVDQTGTIKALRQVTITTGLGPVLYFVVPNITAGFTGFLNVSIGDILHITFDSASTPRNGTYTITAVIDNYVLQVKPIIPALVAESGNAYIQINDSTDMIVVMPSISVPGLETAAATIQNIINVVSVKSQVNGLELYATEKGGTFSGNIIYLATDVDQANVGDDVIVYFNSYEIYNITNNNGSVSANNIILSTDDVLDFNSVLQPLNNIFNGLNVKPIFVDYIVSDIDVIDNTAMSLMPFIGSVSTSTLTDKNASILTSRQPTEFNSNGNVVRLGASYLAFNVAGAFSAGGTFAVKGTGWFEITASIPVTQANVGGVFDLLPTILNNIGVVSNNYSIAKITSATLGNGTSAPPQVLLLRGYGINDNTYDNSVAVKASLPTNTSISLAPIFADNGITILSLANTLNITFYILAPSSAETIQFTNGRGTLYSKYKYTRIDRIDLISGFVNPNTQLITGTLDISRLSQPATSSTYLTNYSYFGPVENEQITITYQYNNIIQDATNAVEEVRTLTADVLCRLAFKIVINVSMTVILTNSAINQQSQILDQVTSAVSNLITNSLMGSVIDYSSLLRVATAINGVSGADVSLFDFVGSPNNGVGNLKSIQADQNQYFSVGTINIIVGTR